MVFPGQTFVNDNTNEYCISNLFNNITINFLLGFLFEDRYNITFVFVVFRDNLFAFN
jgi:hypothetical protein